jgi:TolA-binding protein
MKKSPKTPPSAPSDITPKAKAAASPALATANSGATLTDDQMQQLAQSFHDISVAIGQIRLDAIKAGASLTDTRIVQLQGNVFSLMQTANNLALQGAKLTLEDAEQALNQISVATQTADHALDKLAGIDKAVQIASAVIVLGAAISTQNPAQIISAAKLVVTSCGVSLS